VKKKVVTPGYNKRRNIFITLLWPKRKGNEFVFNTYTKRRSREYDLTSPTQCAGTRSEEDNYSS